MRIFTSAVLVVASCAFASDCLAKDSEGRSVSLGFVENGGAIDARARFFVRAGGMTAFLTDQAFVLSGSRRTELGYEGANIRLSFEDSSDQVRVVGETELPGKVHFFKGQDPGRWATGLSTFDAVVYDGLYPGTNLRVHDDRGQLEYDLLLAPGADPGCIVIRSEGTDAIELDDQGALLLVTENGTFRQEPPVTYSVTADGSRNELGSRFVLLGEDRFGFQVDGWPAAGASLVIDPVMSFTSYLGGGESDGFGGVATGADGSIYLAGHTLSVDFPTTIGAFDETFNGFGVGADDAFVVKLDPTGSTLLYATFLGGTDGNTFLGEFACDIQLNGLNQAHVVGTSTASDFPTTAGVISTSRSGPQDAFVTKLSADGSALMYSTYLGGSDAENAVGLALNDDGEAYVTGDTSSTNFPTTANAFDTSLDGPGWFDGFLAVLDSTGTSLTYSTYFGGTEDDLGLGVAVDPVSGIASVVGETDSLDFPVSAGAFGQSSNGGQDIVALKIDPDSPEPDFSTYLGGGLFDAGNAVALDADGNVYVVGGVESSDFPTTPGAFDQVKGGASDAFVSKFTPTGSGLIYSTYLGGTFSGFYDEQANAIAVTPDGRAVVVGETDSGNFPTMGADVDFTLDGIVDAFLTEFNEDGTGLVYSTHVGGSQSDFGSDVALDPLGRGTVVGQTSSNDLVTTAGAVQETFGGGFSDAFIAGFSVPCDGGFEEYGTGCPGSGGFTPVLSGTGCPDPGYTVQLDIEDGLGGTIGFLLAGSGQGAFTLMNGCTWEVLPLVAIVPISLSGAGAGEGSLSLQSALPIDVPSFVIHVQAIFIDPGNPFGRSGTNGLSIGVGIAP